MNADLCTSCLALGYCRDLKVVQVTDTQLADPELIRDVRATAYGCGKSADGWLEYANNLYRDFRGRIVTRGCASCEEVWLDMEELEAPCFRDWCAEWCCQPCPANVQPHVRKEAWERVRVLATILKASFPEQARYWGLRAANDNHPSRSWE